VIQMRAQCITVSLCAALAGCAGVPDLYPDSKPSAPRVNDIARQISCELYSGTSISPLADGKYFVTVLLTLQVDDNVDFTPSLGFISPLSGAMENVTTTVSGDLGGARRRTFTATYTLDATALKDHGAQWCGKFQAANKTYKLDGTLGLNEVVEDGLGIINPARPALHVPSPSTPADKSAPSFGSYIQFIITRSMTGLGPVWTVKRFKGPGGSTGLFNAKRLDTDSVLITFAPQYTSTGPTPKQVAAAAQVQQAQTAANAAAASRTQAEAASKRATADAQSARARATAGGGPQRHALTAALKQQLAQAADQAELAARTVDLQLHSAQITEQSSLATLAGAHAAQRTADEEAAADQAQAPAAAVNAAQSLQQTMILQNLVGALPTR
jgi:hypothetical protein